MENKIWFITGGAGTGKTTIVNGIISTSRQAVCATATTGVASTQLNGTTVHSFFSYPVADDSDWKTVELHANSLREGDGFYEQVKQRIKKTDILIIDEISMMTAKFFENISYYAQSVRDNYEEPFGGMKVVLVGDFLQLPPISKNKEIDWIFNSELWKSSVRVVYLKKVHRQEEEAFKAGLEKVRYGICDQETYDLFSSRENAIFKDGIRPIKLCSKRKIAQIYNDEGLNELSSKLYTFNAIVEGNSASLMDKLKKSCLAPEVLNLKIGCQVMTLVNSPTGQYVNGSMGSIVDFHFSDDGSVSPIVLFEQSKERIMISKYTWKSDNSWNWSTFTQYPLMLAYGITIHKSQGMTLDLLEVDFDEMFAHGQAYVALSRARTLDGIRIKNFDPYAIKANQEAVNFYRNLISE